MFFCLFLFPEFQLHFLFLDKSSNIFLNPTSLREPVEEYDSVSDGESLNQVMIEGSLEGKANDSKEPVLESGQSRNPYKIEMIGVICNAPLAVTQGMRYALSSLLS